jgi:ankyrin repeat protein
MTPLHRAACGTDTSVARALIAAGADPRARDGDGVTPLHLAGWEGAAELVDVLLAGGADVNVRDGRSLTPLWYAVRLDRVPAAKALRRRGGAE